MRWRILWGVPSFAVSLLLVGRLSAQETPAQRLDRAKEFHLRAQAHTGVLVPMYIYPSNIHTNAAYNRLIDVKRRFETVPIWVILNPASGPGEQVDANYTKAIDRLQGAGCMTLAYVTTSYGKRSETDVKKDVDRWPQLYPKIQGVFFDEMRNEDAAPAAAYQASLNTYAHDKGCWPTVANPGTDVPERYFAINAADVFVIHEANAWPKEERVKGDHFGGYSDYPPFTRGVLVHSQKDIDRDALRTTRKYVRWLYVTDGVFDPNDKKSNPWDRVSKHLEVVCEELSSR
jgi:hypothetical protein